MHPWRDLKSHFFRPLNKPHKNHVRERRFSSCETYPLVIMRQIAPCKCDARLGAVPGRQPAIEWHQRSIAKRTARGSMANRPRTPRRHMSPTGTMYSIERAIGNNPSQLVSINLASYSARTLGRRLGPTAVRHPSRLFFARFVGTVSPSFCSEPRNHRTAREHWLRTLLKG